ncbi:putative protein LSM14 -like B isoform 2 [Scophthalmus maximus]|uniref:Uncharacterized protein n=1 Tax=Scophthalmus maximus TaxID=52904 RepID=A0A2U9C0U0_SCOMX|nr:putative protein LSM14 -like B isoform 2 [Scophthalmus maximus]
MAPIIPDRCQVRFGQSAGAVSGSRVNAYKDCVVAPTARSLPHDGRPTDRPTPPKDDIYEYITFRGNDIKDIALCELPSAGSSGVYPAHGPFSPHRMPVYNQLAASSLLHQQYAAALGLGPVLPGLPVRRGPTVEKAVQTHHVERSMQRRSLTVSQEQEPWWERRRPQRTREEGPKSRRGPGTFANLGQALPKAQLETRQPSDENRPPPRRRQGPRRRRNRSRGQLMVANVPSPVLKFDTDFDFDSSNAQFIKEELERGGQDKRKVKDGNHEVEEKGKEKEELRSTAEDDQFGPKCYYDKAKSFFDNISSDNTFSFRLTWAEERKRNLETFGVPGRFLRGRGFRGGYTGPRGRGAAQTLPPYRTRSGQL